MYSSYNGSIKTIGYITVEKWHPNNSKLVHVLILSFTLQDIYRISTLLYFHDIDSLHENEHAVITFEMLLVPAFDFGCA